MKLKNLVLAVGMLFAGITTAVAQEMNWGVKAGINYSTLTSEMDPDHILGFQAGLTAEFNIAPKFALQPELLYSMEGAHSNFEYSDEEFQISSEEKIKLGYINLPVMAKYFVTPAFSLQAGPQVGYLVSGKNEYDISSNFPDDFEMDGSGTEDIKDELKKISFGFNFGLGYEFQNIFLQARYHLGLTNISDFDEEFYEDFEEEIEKLKNRGFQFSVGYKF